jgi:hypothetical protein
VIGVTFPDHGDHIPNKASFGTKESWRKKMKKLNPKKIILYVPFGLKDYIIGIL